MHNPSLDDIRLFVAVVQAGSLSQASELTGIPTSRLSRRLTQLESELGTQLINRGKKGVSLNELGEHFFTHAQNMLKHAQIAIDSIYTGLDKPAGLLRISAPVDISQQILAPLLGEYLQQYPDVSIDINLSQQKVNMIQDGIDVAVRVGEIANDNVVARKICMLHFGIYATADYLAKHGTPATPHELYQHKVIAQTLSLPWQFTQAAQSVKITPSAHLGCNDFLMVENIIAQGLGIGLLSSHAAAKHEHLVQVLTDWQLPAVPLSLIYYKNRGTVPTVRSFVGWLSDRMAG